LATTRSNTLSLPIYQASAPCFDDVKQRIARTLEFIGSVKPEQIEGSEQRDVTLKLGGRDVHFKGQDCLLGFAPRNSYFHLVTAYAILRHNRVPLRKTDYIGSQ
jgi:hypothetical protein